MLYNLNRFQHIQEFNRVLHEYECQIIKKMNTNNFQNEYDWKNCIVKPYQPSIKVMQVLRKL